MPAIVAPGIVRYTLNGEYAGQPIANILDMQIDTTGSVEDRATAIESQAGILINEWTAEILPALANVYRFTSVSWVDLNSLDGTVGERASTDTVSLPQSGGITTAPHPGNVAYRVSKATTPTRGLRQGRMYMVGVPEAATDASNPNLVVSASITSMNTRLANFLGDVNQEEGGPTGYSSMIAVVHTVEGAFDSWTGVNALTLDARLGSQRRRLDL